MARNNRSGIKSSPSNRNRGRQQFGQAVGQAQQSQSLGEDQPESQESNRSVFSQVADTVRENPKTAIAAGAAVAAGVAAAATMARRGRDKKDD